MRSGFRWIGLSALIVTLAIAAAAYATDSGSGIQKASTTRNITRTVKAMKVAAGDVNGPIAYCPAGRRIVSGGFITAGAGVVFTQDSFGGNGWAVGYDNSAGLVEATVKAVAYCAPTGQTVHAASTNGRNDTFRTALRQQRNTHK